MTSPIKFDPSIAFDIVFNQHGGRHNLKQDDVGKNLFHRSLLTYAESIPSVLLEVSKSIKQGYDPDNLVKLPEIHSGLLNCQGLNCYASRSNGRYFVGMSTMIPIALLEMAAFFFSEEDFLPMIGDNEDGPMVKLDGLETLPFFQIAENKFRPMLPKNMSDAEAESLYKSICVIRGNAGLYESDTGRRLSANEYLTQFDTLIDLLLPVCQIRRAHCKYMAEIMEHFFWFHEIAHVTQGHLRHFEKQTEAPVVSLREFPDLAYSGLETGEIRITTAPYIGFELDADIEAALMTIGSIMLDLDIESDDFPYVDRYARLEIFVFTLIAVLGSFSMRYNRSNIEENLTHPCSQIRLQNVILHLTNFTDDDPKLGEAIGRGMSLAASLGQYPRFSYLASCTSLNDEDLENLFEIGKQRLNLPNAFDTFGYGNLRPLITNWLDETSFRAKFLTP